MSSSTWWNLLFLFLKTNLSHRIKRMSTSFFKVNKGIHLQCLIGTQAGEASFRRRDWHDNYSVWVIYEAWRQMFYLSSLCQIWLGCRVTGMFQPQLHTWYPICNSSPTLFEIFIFCPKIQHFPKNSWKCCGFGLLGCWQLWFHEKNCQKNLGEKLVKMLGFCQNWIFWTKFDFLISVFIILSP